MKLDLHTHTTCSDGTDAPIEIINKTRNYVVISITDHDTIDAYKELKVLPDNLISGVEISAEFDTTLHILGYNFDINNAEFNAKLYELQQYRKDRNEKMLSKMKNLGFDITWKELVDEAKSELIGRPHFAKVLLKKGYINNIQEAFDKYLAKGKPLYLDKKRMQPKEAIELILQAGGMPVMAHPFQTKLVGYDLEKLISELVGYGLAGIEAFYSTHSKSQIEFCLEMAKKYNLHVTAGSDYHGKNKTIELGMDIDKTFVESIFPDFVNFSEK